jgi:protein-S-isoprenylcysteine O-methyltransferase Ste14
VSTLVIVFRTVALLAFAGPMLLGVGARRRAPKARTRRHGRGRAPVVANFAAFGLFFPSLIIFSGSANSFTALLLALLGSLVTEETLLSRTFGRRYALYQKQTKMIIPYLL